MVRIGRDGYSKFRIDMRSSLCRTLRTLGTLILGLAVPIAAYASVTMRDVSVVQARIGSDSTPAILIQSATSLHRVMGGASEGFTVRLTTPTKSAGHRSSRRISAEDTTAPSLDALETTGFRIPMEREARPRPAQPVRRSAIASPATRQRAP